MSLAVPMGRVAGASPRLKARIAGLFYLLTFLIGGVVLSAGRGLVVPEDAAATAANIVALESSFRLAFAAELLVIACYIAVTALFYELFKPVSRSLSRAAAQPRGVRCSGFRCLLESRPLGHFERRALLERIQGGTVAGAVAPVSQAAFSGLQPRPGIFWLLLSPDWLPHSKVDLPASCSGRADGARRIGMADLSVAAARKVSVALHSGPWNPRGGIADPVAPRDGCERSTLERPGQRS
jgi:hypothetical protein